MKFGASLIVPLNYKIEVLSSVANIRISTHRNRTGYPKKCAILALKWRILVRIQRFFWISCQIEISDIEKITVLNFNIS
jgi:hypothetical protein